MFHMHVHGYAHDVMIVSLSGKRGIDSTVIHVLEMQAAWSLRF